MNEVLTTQLRDARVQITDLRLEKLETEARVQLLERRLALLESQLSSVSLKSSENQPRDALSLVMDNVKQEHDNPCLEATKKRAFRGPRRSHSKKGRRGSAGRKLSSKQATDAQLTFVPLYRSSDVGTGYVQGVSESLASKVSQVMLSKRL